MPQAAQAFPGASAPPLSSGSSPLPPSQPQVPQFPPGVKAPTADSEHGVPPGVVPSAQRPASTVPSQAPQQAPQTRPNAFPGSLSDLVASFESVKQKGAWLRVAYAFVGSRG